MATQNNVHIPDDLLAEVKRLAEQKGGTADDLAAAALKQYIGHEQLENLARYGRERARAMGLDQLSEDEQMAYVDRMIHEHRRERRR
jgi:hypothetical protein